MSNGKAISVDDMDLNHLRNTLKMIIKSNQKRKTKTKLSDCQELEESLGYRFHDDENRNIY